MRSKPLKRRLIVFGSFSFLAIAYFLYTAISYTYSVISLNDQKKTLDSELVELEAKEVTLSSEVTKLKDPEYLARYARENYLYSKDDEYIIKINETTKTDDEVTETNDNYAIYAGLLLIILMFTYIMIKTKKAKKKKV